MKRLLILGVMACFGVSAQEASSSSLGDVKWMWGMVKGNLAKSAEKMPEDKYGYKPVDEVRSYGQILAHVANAHYGLCSAAIGEKPKVTGLEKSKTTRADIIQALNESIAFCDEVINGMTEAKAGEKVKFFGGERTRAGVLMFNVLHDNEHYGNLVTYMRANKIVPPSSERRQ